MKKTVFTFLLVVVLALSVVPAVSAAAVPLPTGSCPAGFELHEYMVHEAHGHHIGLTVNLNNDAYVCVKELSNGLHVHVDNFLP